MGRDRVDAYLEAHRGDFEEQLKKLLRIPSVSAQPDHDPDTRRAAEIVRHDLAAIRDELVPGVGDDVLSRALMAWTMLFGTISYELFGHLHNVIHDYDAFFDLQLGRAADLVISR
jgi:hypothetical protein